jgi:hypothetical protein
VQPDGMEPTFRMSEIFRIGPAGLGKALDMNFFLGIQIRGAVLTAILISGAVPVVRAEFLPGAIPNGLSAFQAVGLHPSALSQQDSQAGTQSTSGTHGRTPSVNSGHAGSAPIVAYENGLLTIVAENVPLSEVMTALHNVMGTEIELPAGASDDRVWARLGPGPARKVLSDLLSNTDLNYIIQGSASDADGIQSVALTAHTVDVTPSQGGASNQAAGRMDSRRQPRTDTATTETPDQEVPASQEPAVPTVVPAVPAVPAVAAEVTPPSSSPVAVEPPSVSATAQSSVADSFAHPGPPASLTQEQMSLQLMNMYQQRKQLQQNQAGSTPN